MKFDPKINYAAAYDNPKHIRHKEARVLADKLRQETILATRGTEAGVLRWKSNGSVVSANCATLAYLVGIGISRDACADARRREILLSGNLRADTNFIIEKKVKNEAIIYDSRRPSQGTGTAWSRP